MQTNIRNKQHGTALIVALLMLLILAIIGISGMNDSIFDLRMTGNIQNYYDSLQQSDSGIVAAISQGSDNFESDDKSDVFAAGGSNTLKDYINSTVNIDFLYEEQSSTASKKGYSANFFNEEYYIVDSDHADSNTGANTHIYQGVRRKILAL